MRFPITSFIIVTFSLSLWTLILLAALKTLFSNSNMGFILDTFSNYQSFALSQGHIPLLLSRLVIFFFAYHMLYIIYCRKSEICLPLWDFKFFYQIVQLIAIMLSFIGFFFSCILSLCCFLSLHQTSPLILNIVFPSFDLSGESAKSLKSSGIWFGYSFNVFQHCSVSGNFLKS